MEIPSNILRKLDAPSRSEQTLEYVDWLYNNPNGIITCQHCQQPSLVLRELISSEVLLLCGDEDERLLTSYNSMRDVFAVDLSENAAWSRFIGDIPKLYFPADRKLSVWQG